ncbi:MAG: hypothetical protein PHQ19_01640 [Candidatus Krumholzibacteria bacterium]|nr:hypothetical protein [Candidatus Krumholzibacteria bacterium]
MRLIVSASIAAAFVLLTSAASNAQDWNFHVVDDAGDMGGFSRIAVTSGGIPHILYKNLAANTVRLAWWVPDGMGSGHWERRQVASGSYSSDYIRLAIDAYDRVHISYGGMYPSNGIWYGIYDPAAEAWTLGPEQASARRGKHDMTLYEDAGNVTVVMALTYFNILYVDRRDPGSGLWSEETAYSSSAVSELPSVAVDSGGGVHVSFYETGGANLMYATDSRGGGWAAEYVDIAGAVGYYSSIVIDTGDVPYIVYYDGTNDDLKWARLVTP